MATLTSARVVGIDHVRCAITAGTLTDVILIIGGLTADTSDTHRIARGHEGRSAL